MSNVVIDTMEKGNKNNKRHTRSASDMRMCFSLYGPLGRADLNKILERKQSLPRNFKLHISSDPEEFVKKTDKK